MENVGVFEYFIDKGVGMGILMCMWMIFTVRYWDQDPRINDCFGNSVSWVGKARTCEEAIRKAKVKRNKIWFRLHSVQTANFYAKYGN